MKLLGTIRGRAVLSVLAVVSLAAPHPGLAEGDATFDLVAVPSLSTPVGELPTVIARDINDRGELAGQARNPAIGRSAAIRFSAARGLEDLDPDGEYSSLAWAINRRGTVFGYVLGGPIAFSELFLHSVRGGFDFLEVGKTDAIREGFQIGFLGRGALTRSGAVFGSVLVFGSETAFIPHIYTKRRGWRDLSGEHPRFSEPTFGAYINDKGYQVFVIPGSSPPGETPPTGRQEVFVRTPGGEIHELVGPGRPVTPGSRPNRRGRMAGLYLTDNAQERAYVWTPAGGMSNIHPEGFKESAAFGTNKKGAVYGVLARGNSLSDVFVHTESQGLHVVVSESELEELGKNRNGRFKDVYPHDMNDRGEIVGCVRMRQGADFSFYYSPTRGLFDVSVVLDELDAGYTAGGCTAQLINNKSQILLTNLRDGTRSTSGILTVTD